MIADGGKSRRRIGPDIQQLQNAVHEFSRNGLRRLLRRATCQPFDNLLGRTSADMTHIGKGQYLLDEELCLAGLHGGKQRSQFRKFARFFGLRRFLGGNCCDEARLFSVPQREPTKSRLRPLANGKLVDEGIQDTEITDFDQGVLETGDLQSVQRNRKNLGVRGFSPFGSDELGSGLIKLPVATFAGRFIPERGADVAKTRFAFRRELRLVLRRLQLAQIGPTGRNRHFRPQTDFPARGIGKDVHASTNVLS